MKLSIITVNLNNAAGLKATLESVAVQTCQEFEHIIIDGGSSDGSVPIIKSYEETIVANRFNNKTQYPLITWVSELDKGIYDGMNKGIAHATGEYVYFLNSGDTFTDSSVIHHLLEELKQDTDIIVSRINFVDANGNYHADYQPRMQRVTLYNYLQHGIPHQAAIIKKTLFTQYGLYDLQYRIVADWEFFLRVLVLNSATLRYIDETITNFDGTGLTSKQGSEMMREIDTVLRNSVPERVYEDYKWMLSVNGDIKRVEWMQYHPYIHKVVKSIVALGRKVCK